MLSLKTHYSSGRSYMLWLVSVVFLLGCDACDRNADTLLINNSATDFPTYAYIDSYRDGNFRTDEAFESPQNATAFNWELTANHDQRGPDNAEVTAFTVGHPPVIRNPANFTNNVGDAIGIGFTNEMVLDVTVWVVWAQNDNQMNRRLDDLTESLEFSNRYWYESMMGARIGEVTVRDRRDDSDAEELRDCDNCATYGCMTTLTSQIGSTAGQINIYLVRKVEGSRNLACVIQNGRNIVLGSRVNKVDTPHHSFTHLFGLDHPNEINSSLSSRNAAHGNNSLFTTRKGLTNGQVFRAHASSVSAINDIYNARAGEYTIGCEHSTSTTLRCPSIEKNDHVPFISFGIAY